MGAVKSFIKFSVCAATAFISSLAFAQQRGHDLPDWFEQNRVQAHFENRIQDDLAGLYAQLHPAVHDMGASVLTRIFKTVGEGAWWPTDVGKTHPLLQGRDLGREMTVDAHRNGLKLFAYYRIMCDDEIEREHPEWLCRDAQGELVLEPRTRRRPNQAERMHVICFNSPARTLIERRLLELADRGVDGIYFDSWHMPEVCTCDNCRAAYREETGRQMQVDARRGSAAYEQNAAFVARSIVRNYRQWKRAVHERHPEVLFAIGSSLYPCFDRQMQITAPLLEISDTSKTEFNKPFGGPFTWPVVEGQLARPDRRRPYLDETCVLPSYDLQNALGWSLTRDSCDGRPPLMWIPFTRTEQEATFSAAAAVSYGCIASIHPTGLWSRRDGIQPQAAGIYRAAYELSGNVSPHLAHARPSQFALIHVSERARNARIDDPRALWTEFFAPILGIFEALKEAHIPVATINDLQLERNIPAETQILLLPHPTSLSDRQLAVVKTFQRQGGTAVRLGPVSGWHLRSDKSQLKRDLLEGLAARMAAAPLHVHGPPTMHAVYYRHTDSTKQVICLVNDFGWFRCEREPNPNQPWLLPPQSCRNVTVEIAATEQTNPTAREAVTHTQLEIVRTGDKWTLAIPDFAVMACVVVTTGTRVDANVRRSP